MVRNASVTKKPIQVEIFPQQMLMPHTAEQLLNGIDKVPGVIRMLIRVQACQGRYHADPEQALR